MATTTTTTIHLAHLSHPKGVAEGQEDADTAGHRPLYITLFKNVSNASYIRQQLLDQNTDFEYAFVDASAVISTTHVLSAAYRALNDMRASRLRTRNVHAEIVFAFSASNNIADSLRRFGINESTTNLLAVKVGNPQIDGSTVYEHLTSSIQGDAAPFDDAQIATTTDWSAVRKNYKLPRNFVAPARSGGDGAVDEKEKKEMRRRRWYAERIAIGGMALRGA
ncbi:MAG: hypothetical protein M1831_005737 [Alyxoria varia]|nr:MAG: hypothetical protein M1831_005737 [Alyxoria varia]